MWFRNNPAFVLTLIYLGMSLFGAVLQAVTFARLGLNYFDFAQPADFFLAPLRRPDATITALVAVSVGAFSHLGTEWALANPERVAQLKKKWWGRIVFDDYLGFGFGPRFGKTVARRWTAMALVFMLVWIFVERSLFAAHRLLEGRGRRVVIELLNGQRVEGEQLVTLTSQFAVVYSHEQQRAAVYSLGAIRAITLPSSQPATNPLTPAP